MYSNLYCYMRRFIWRGGKEIRRNLRVLEDWQWLSRQHLEAYQLMKIQQIVSYAYENVPYYRNRYQSEDVHPQDIKSLKDFQALPFLTRDDVNNHQKDLISTEYRGKVFESTTGGSTGRPMRFLMDRSTGLWSNAVEYRCRGWYGIKPGDKMAWIYASLKDFSNWRWQDRILARIKRYRYLNPRTMNKAKMQTFAEMALKWQPVIFRSYPSAISIFANYLKDRGIDGIIPKLIEITGEKATPSQRQLLEEVFRAPVADHYSSWEIYDMAYQCPNGGLHVNEDRYIELVAKGQVIKAGQMGEVVITSLNQYAMPFIRYKNEDIGIYETEKCPCGRGMPVLREIVGRNSDLLLKPNGDIVHWSSFYTIIRHKPEVSQCQLYQPDRQHLEVRLVCNKNVDSALFEDIRHELKNCFGESINISIKVVDRIDLTPSGKHRFIISEVKPDFL